MEPAWDDNLETRQRLLRAAGEIFAEVGFRSATIREICERAGANIAAVNYHFGGKEGLYAAVLRYAYECSKELYPLTLNLPPEATGEEKLATFIRLWMLHIFDEGRPAWHGKLMSREMMEPTAALDMLIQEHIRPRSQVLQGIVRELLPAAAVPEAIARCTMSIIGQCIFYHHCRPVISRLHAMDEKFTRADIERIAGHITQFSLAALRHWPEGAGKEGNR
jgi:AcrR family transcriptional regulator